MLSYEKCVDLANQWDPEGESETLLEELQSLEDVYDNSYTEEIEKALQEAREK